jgi:uncharacterized protein (DUF1697 family)
MDDVQVWFLRGINVGGAHRLPMAALREHLGALGATEVRTYIQSGNVAFRVPGDVAEALPGRFEAEAPGRYGFAVPVVARTASELSAIAASNPFLADVDDQAGVDHRQYHLGLFREPPRALLDAGLEPATYRPDDLVVAGRDVYFYLPNGVSGSVLFTKKGFAKLTGSMTVRNWRTVLATLALASELRAGA